MKAWILGMYLFSIYLIEVMIYNDYKKLIPILLSFFGSHKKAYTTKTTSTLIRINDLTKRCYEVALFQSLMAKVLLGCGVCLRSLDRSLMTHLSSFLGPARWNHFPIQRVRNLSPKSWRTPRASLKETLTLLLELINSAWPLVTNVSIASLAPPSTCQK
jgi:hypothetical protein